MSYDYKERVKQINEILNSKTEVETKKNVSEIEKEDNGGLTYKNGIKGWVTSIFVDIVDSTNLFKNGNTKQVAKIIRIFTSEVIQILNDTTLFKKIGIRGDAVFAVYSTPNIQDDIEIFNMAVEINTLKKLINKRLESNNFPTIDYGIGIASAIDLVIKVGRKGINNELVFVGEALVTASKLGDLSSRDGIKGIAMSPIFYNSIKEKELKENNDFGEWFSKDNKDRVDFYHGNVVKTNFSNWIEGY